MPDERTNAVYVSGTGSLPNVLVSVPCGVPLPQLAIDGINALLSDDPLLACMAEYRPNELLDAGLIRGMG